MKNLLIVVAVSLSLLACSQNSNKKEGTVASIPAEASKETPVKSQMPVNADILLPEVEAKYSGIVISVVKKSDNSSTEIAVPFTVKTDIKGTPLAIEVLSLFPEFKMVEGGVTNASMNETNPGAKVRISKNGTAVFTGWLFQAFPGMHGLEDPDYNIVMVKSTAKK